MLFGKFKTLCYVFFSLVGVCLLIVMSKPLVTIIDGIAQRPVSSTYKVYVFIFGFLCVLISVACVYFCNKIYKKANMKFLNDLDCKSYLQFLDEIEYKVSIRIRYVVRIAKSAPLIGDSKYDKAEKLLLSTSLPKCTRGNSIYHINYYNNLCCIYIYKKQFDLAQENIDKMNLIIKDKKVFNHNFEIMKQWVSNLQYCLNIEKGKIEGAEEYFSAQIAFSENRYLEISNKYRLAKTLVLKGEKDRAIPLLQYVIDNGNGINIAIMADELLKSINSQESIKLEKSDIQD